MNTHKRMRQTTATAEAVALRKSILDQTEASLSLAKHVIDACARQSNFIFSPLSIHVLLGLVASGSNGPTRDQILDFLKSKSLDDLHALFSECVSRVLADGSSVGGPVLSTANGLWVDDSLTLKPGYRNIVENVYKAVSKNVDFKNKADEVVEEVNAWAERETKGIIKQVVSPRSVNPSITRLILANALYFKGAWQQSFNKMLTEEREFYLLNRSSVRAAMMSSWEKQYVSCFDGFKVLRLPYKQGGDTDTAHARSFAMYIYLPDARDGLAALTERVCSEPGFIDSHLPDRMEKLDEFRVPKFKISFDMEASHLLRELGLVLPFSGGGLSEMVVEYPPLDVSRIFHKAVIEVNEEGTVAAAVSVMMATYGCSWMRQRLEFVADHPFLFLIREETTALILFIGHLLNPVP